MNNRLENIILRFVAVSSATTTTTTTR